MRAVLLVSGGGAVTPYTTPDQAAGSGLAAGNTMTALRSHLLAAGRSVYTAPARIGPGTVTEDAGWQGFADVPEVLPADVTVNAVGDIDAAGASLARFLRWLTAHEGVTEIDIVAHSMGGLFSRAALRERADDSPRVTRLVTLGTPWTGGLLGDVVVGDLTLADAAGDTATENILRTSSDYARAVSQGAAEEVSERFLAGEDGWNARQRGVLDGLPVTLVAGRYFHAATEPAMLWPHDGLVSLRSARADLVGDDVLPLRSVHEFDDVHSIFFADTFGLDWTRALTWDPDVFEVVDAALA